MRPDPIYVFIVSWNRPLYLWASLDSFYRHTRHPCRFVIADNASEDPAVRPIIEGFARRGMFEAVHFCEDNDPDRLTHLLQEYAAQLGEYYVYIDADVVVHPSEPCWLSRFVELMRADPQLGLLGSLIDTVDFIDLEAARRVLPDQPQAILADLIKLRSPERGLSSSYEQAIIEPFNTPGRLVISRTDALERVPIMRDSQWYRRFKELGYHAGIATGVVHRHLSLLNLFDYPEYDTRAREEHHSRTGRAPAAPPSHGSRPL